MTTDLSVAILTNNNLGLSTETFRENVNYNIVNIIPLSTKKATDFSVASYMNKTIKKWLSYIG